MRSLLFGTLCIVAAGCSTSNKKTTNASQKDSTVKTSTKYAVVPASNTDAQTFYYGPSVSTIMGIICKKPVYSVLHEDDSIPRDTVLVIALQKKIAVINPVGTDTSNHDNDPNEYNVDTMQLVTPSYHSLDKYMGHIIQLTGTLFHGDNGNHHTDVLLFVNEAKDSGNSGVLKFNY